MEDLLQPINRRMYFLWSIVSMVGILVLSFLFAIFLSLTNSGDSSTVIANLKTNTDVRFVSVLFSVVFCIMDYKRLKHIVGAHKDTLSLFLWPVLIHLILQLTTFGNLDMGLVDVLYLFFFLFLVFKKGQVV